MDRLLERLIFHSRWLLAPLYLGLVGSLAILTVKSIQEFAGLLPTLLKASESDTILSVLTLVDIVLVANLMLLVTSCGFENFVSKIEVGDHPDRPSWKGKVDMSGLKLRLIALIVAISSIQVLKSFMHIGTISDRELAWLVSIHLTFVTSGVLLALMDRITPSNGHGRWRNVEP